jgi:hypothetical protein
VNVLHLTFPILVFLSMSAVGILMPQRSFAQAGTLNESLTSVAEDVSSILKKRDRDSVALGPFNGPPAITSGAEISAILTELLDKKSISIKSLASVSLRGSFELDTDETVSHKIFRLKFELVDGNGHILSDINGGRFQEGKRADSVRDEKDILRISQVTVALPPDEPSSNRFEKIEESLNRDGDGPFIAPDGVVYAEKRLTLSGRYGVAVIVDNKIVQPKLDEKLAIVEIPVGKSYQVQLFNESAFDAAAEVRIDGLSTFQFSEERIQDGSIKGIPKYTHWIIPAGQQSTVPGWHIRDIGEDNISTFVVSRYAESAAAHLNQELGVGSIQVIFSAAWEGNNKPDDELTERGAPANGTAKGPSTTVAVQPIKRTVGVSRAAVTIRYSK